MKTLLKRNPRVVRNEDEASEGYAARERHGLVSVLPLVVLSIFLLGTKECQEDYDLGSQTEVSDPTGTPTPTSTASATPTSTPTATATGTVTPTGTVDDDTEAARARLKSSSLLSSLMELADQGSADRTQLDRSNSTGRGVGGANAEDQSDNPYARAAGPENWLGLGFSSRIEDTDGDGFCDWLEAALDADPRDRASTPPTPPSKLRAELLADGDGDGVFDGIARATIEGADGSTARLDSDGDGLPDFLEGRFGSDPRLIDSDKDGAIDSEEFVLGIDPLNRDSDSDGILDGAEVRLESDPAFPESAVR